MRLTLPPLLTTLVVLSCDCRRYLCRVLLPWHRLHSTARRCSGASSTPPLLTGSRWSTVKSLVVPHTSHQPRLRRSWALSFRHAALAYGDGPLLPWYLASISALCRAQRLPIIVSSPQSIHGRWNVIVGSQAVQSSCRTLQRGGRPHALSPSHTAGHRLPRRLCPEAPPVPPRSGQAVP